jgi:hypothetical protein
MREAYCHAGGLLPCGRPTVRRGLLVTPHPIAQRFSSLAPHKRAYRKPALPVADPIVYSVLKNRCPLAHTSMAIGVSRNAISLTGKPSSAMQNLYG